MMRCDEIPSFIDKYNNTGVYTTVLRYNNPDQNIALMYGDLYFDFDIHGLIDGSTADAFQKVRNDCIHVMALLTSIYKIGPEQLRIYFSGKKGLHLVVPAVALGVEPRKDLNEVFKFIVEEATRYCANKTIDTHIYDRRRLFRLPGSKHQDTGLYKIPITLDELYVLSFADITELAQRPRIINIVEPKFNPLAKKMYNNMVANYETKKPKFDDNHKPDRILKYTPPCIQNLLFSPTNNGQRNNTLAVLVSFFKCRGMNPEETYTRTLKWNQNYCCPPMCARELENTVKSIHHGNAQYGCATLQKISKCTPNKCRIARGNSVVPSNTEGTFPRSQRTKN